MEYRPNFTAKPLDCVRGKIHGNLKYLHLRIKMRFFLFTEYQHLMNGIGIKRLNTGLGLNITDFATNNCFFILDLSPEQCNNSHLHG